MKANLLDREATAGWQWFMDAAAIREAARTGRRYHGEAAGGPHPDLPWNAEALVRDLQLETLFDAMAGEDDLVRLVAEKEILTGLKGNHEAIDYRQAIVADALGNPALVEGLYAAAVEGMEEERKHYLGSMTQTYPDSVLRWSIELIEALLGPLQRLSRLAKANRARCRSEGMGRLLGEMEEELSDTYLAEIRAHLSRLKLHEGEVMSARLGPGNAGADYRLHEPLERRDTFWMRFLRRLAPWLFERGDDASSFAIAPGDENGHRALRDLKNRGIAAAAEALGDAAMHIKDFLTVLRVELAFYVGCVNLHAKLSAKGEPWCLPDVAAGGGPRLTVEGLYDPCLSLRTAGRVVGNDVAGNWNALIVVTGANEGGKSTFLRSVGVAQLMMECGMFVAAKACQANLATGIATHFRREEDATLRQGKLEEELARMSGIVDHFRPGMLILLNESFSSTNEREGSEIAMQVVETLKEHGARIVYVTHLYEFAHGLHELGAEDVLFLRAGRQPGGERTFRLLEGEPLDTGYGEDLYRRAFGEGPAPLGTAIGAEPDLAGAS